METMLVPMIVAAAVTLLVFGVVSIIISLTGSGSRVLQQRLSSEGRGDSPASAQRRIMLEPEATGLSGRLVRFAAIARLQRALAQACPEVTVSRFLGIASVIGLTFFVLAFVGSGSAIVALAAGAVGLSVPNAWLAQRRAKRQRLLADQLPEALDFLGRVLKAGHSFSTGLQMMGEELPRPLSSEFQRAYDQASLGLPVEQCLKDMADRIKSTDFAFFVTAVLIQRQTGGDLAEVLGNIGEMIRQRVRLQQQVKARTAEGRFTGYILTAFPAVMFVLAYVINPDYAGVLVNTNTGLTLLAIAFGLQMAGLCFIKRITRVVVEAAEMPAGDVMQRRS